MWRHLRYDYLRRLRIIEHIYVNRTGQVQRIRCSTRGIVIVEYFTVTPIPMYSLAGEEGIESSRNQYAFGLYVLYPVYAELNAPVWDDPAWRLRSR